MIDRYSINYIGLSEHHKILAKTSLVIEFSESDQNQSFPSLPKEVKNYLDFQSFNWLVREQVLIKNLALARQVHGAEIFYINEPGIYQGIDGFYTDQPEIYLTIRTADCVAVLVSIPKIPAVGIVHAGWRGLKTNIAGNLIEQMRKRWDIDPKHFRIAISPHIRECCYEVGEEFHDYFHAQYLQSRNDRLYLDLGKVTIDQLVASGIERENLSVSQDCTYCSSLPLYSYRAQKKTSNRLLSIISIWK